MDKYDKCSYCKSTNVVRKEIDTNIIMHSAETDDSLPSNERRIISYATDAYICRDCGHIDFFNFGQDIEWQ